MTGLLVAVGAAIGAALRYAVGRALDRPADQGWPRGTLLVNLAGSLVLGAVVGAGASTPVVALVGTGFCGGLTTYSAFAVQAVERPGRPGAAYVAASVGGCLAAAALGWLLVT